MAVSGSDELWQALGRKFLTRKFTLSLHFPSLFVHVIPSRSRPEAGLSPHLASIFIFIRISETGCMCAQMPRPNLFTIIFMICFGLLFSCLSCDHRSVDESDLAESSWPNQSSLRKLFHSCTSDVQLMRIMSFASDMQFISLKIGTWSISFAQFRMLDRVACRLQVTCSFEFWNV